MRREYWVGVALFVLLFGCGDSEPPRDAATMDRPSTDRPSTDLAVDSVAADVPVELACPSAPNPNGRCLVAESEDAFCDYSPQCCTCSCPINSERTVWECFDPTTNQAECEASPPTVGSPCAAAGTMRCEYCTPSMPRTFQCAGGVWMETTAILFDCPPPNP